MNVQFVRRGLIIRNTMPSICEPTLVKNILHKNAAARKKSRLQRAVNKSAASN